MTPHGSAEPRAIDLADDGLVPNSRLPLLVYTAAFPAGADPEAFEGCFAEHGWTGSWRDGIYPFAHYHSTSHEVLGIVQGKVKVRLGGSSGVTAELAAGDVVVIPAGVAHQRLSADADLLVVGAYPEGRRWDLCRCRPDERPAADRAIAAVPTPGADPLYGPGGPLTRLWRPLPR